MILIAGTLAGAGFFLDSRIQAAMDRVVIKVERNHEEIIDVKIEVEKLKVRLEKK